MKTTSSIKNAVLLLVSLFIFSSCSKDDEEISPDLAGSWTVICFMDGNEKITKTEDNTWPDINNGDITADFTEPDSNGKGTISGITVSNTYHGNYTILENGKISIGPITSTLIDEPEWTRLFNVGSAENFEIRDSKLVIYYNNGNNNITFERN